MIFLSLVILFFNSAFSVEHHRRSDHFKNPAKIQKNSHKENKKIEKPEEKVVPKKISTEEIIPKKLDPKFLEIILSLKFDVDPIFISRNTKIYSTSQRICKD